MATKKIPAKLIPEGVTPMPTDFVYCGRRNAVSGGLACAVLWLTDPPQEGLYKMSKTPGLIGGIYTGAKLAGTVSSGIDNATYTGNRWPDKAQTMEWEAEDSSCRTADRCAKLEADAGKQTLIERSMGPLRELYTNLSDRGDWAGMKALEVAVVNALHRRTKSANKGEYK